MVYELFRKLIKEEIEYNEQSGQMQKGDILEYAFKQLAAIDNESYNKTIEQYRLRKEELFKQMNKTNDELTRLIDEYYKALMETL